MRLKTFNSIAVTLCASVLMSAAGNAVEKSTVDIRKVVAQAVEPLMQRHGIPGMAVGVVVHGRRYVYSFGVMSKATGQPVTDGTLRARSPPLK